MSHRHPQKRLWAASLALAFLLVSALAWAGVHKHTGTHLTKKSPEDVWKVLSAYSEICGKGCRYERPNLVQVKKLSIHASSSSWYTWSHVENTLRDVKYFSKVTIRWNKGGGFSTDTLQLNESHRKLIDELEAKTGLKHRPAFDTANTTTTAQPQGSSTLVKQHVVLTSSGLLDLWPAKVMEGIREHMAATFRNIGP